MQPRHLPWVQLGFVVGCGRVERRKSHCALSTASPLSSREADRLNLIRKAPLGVRAFMTEGIGQRRSRAAGRSAARTTNSNAPICRSATSSGTTGLERREPLRRQFIAGDPVHLAVVSRNRARCRPSTVQRQVHPCGNPKSCLRTGFAGPSASEGFRRKSELG